MDTNDESGVFTDDGLDTGQAFVKHTQRVGLLEVDTTRTGRLFQRVHVDGPVVVVSDGSDVNFCPLAVIVHDRHLVGRCEGRDIDGVRLAGLAVVNTNGTGQGLSGGR